MSTFTDRYHSLLRPCRKRSDMFLLAALNSLLLMVAGTIIGTGVMHLLGFPSPMSTENLTQIALGRVTAQEVTGVPDYISCASNYIMFIGIWIVFVMAFAIPRANRKMLQKLVLIRDGRSLKLFGLGALLGLGINSICVLMSVLLGDISLHFEHFEVGPLLLLLLAVFIQSGAEEITCRLFLYQKLARRYRNPAVAITLSAVFFAACHVANPGITAVGIAQIVVIGILLSVLVYYYDALGACIALHTAWNFAQNILYGLPNSGLVSLYSVFKLDAASNGIFFDSAFGVEGGIGSVVLLALACAGLIVYAKKRNLKPHDMWADDELAVAQQVSGYRAA